MCVVQCVCAHLLTSFGSVSLPSAHYACCSSVAFANELYTGMYIASPHV
jgi:hypothetical protein